MPTYNFLLTFSKLLNGTFTNLAQVPSPRGRVRVGADFLLISMSNKSHFWSSLAFDSLLTSNRHDLVLLGKCLGFAPRSESFAIEPSVQVCSISSLSEFRFAQYVRKSAMPNLQNFTSDQNGQ